MAKAAVRTLDEDTMVTLILDYENAFMAVPLLVGEQPYNCCEVTQGLLRKRKLLYKGEPRQGTFVVW